MAKLTRLRTAAGFTLIEMMTVVVIIGILIAIAIPNYQDYLLRSKLVDAGSTLSQIRVALEQYYQDNRSYPADKECRDIVDKIAKQNNLKWFAYSCTVTEDLQGFTVKATGTPTGGTSAFAYTVDQLNNRETTALPTGWASDTGCWITAKGQACK